MQAAEITSRTAWITALLLGLQASLGLFRVRAVPSAYPVWRRWVLVDHVAIGVALPVFSFLHVWFSVKQPSIRGTSTVGLWIGTLGTLFMVSQILVGSSMLGTVEHTQTRRLHFAIATVLVVLAGAHIALNG